MGNDEKPKKQLISSAAALYTANQNSSGCIFWSSADHKPEACADHNVVECKEKLKKTGRCFVCLDRKDIAEFCNTKNVVCGTCGGRHHSAVCNKGKPSPSVIQESTDTAVSSVIPQTGNLTRGTENTVLLQTVRAWLLGPAGRKVARCLLDGGSGVLLVNSFRLVGEIIGGFGSFGGYFRMGSTRASICSGCGGEYVCVSAARGGRTGC